MKKVLISILSLTYLVATCGVGMNLHYCCDKLAKVDLSFTADPVNTGVSCDMQSVYQGKGCCRDVHKELKITLAQHTGSEVAFVSTLGFTVALPTSSQTLTRDITKVAQERFLPHGPPGSERSPVYLRNCSLLI